MQNIKGAIFDMDGTLLDSMPVWKRLTQNYLKQFDLHITDQDFAACEGFSQPQVADYFLARHPELPLTREQMLDGMDALLFSSSYLQNGQYFHVFLPDNKCSLNCNAKLAQPCAKK